jgi:two-component system, cell cycle response regulator DivK
MVVEDNALSSTVLSRRLRRCGFSVLLATDGPEGVAMTRSHRPDLVLMDLRLPTMDGLDAIRGIRQAPETSKIPVIAITAYAMAADRERCLSAGADDYEAKPVDFDRLLRKINTLLNRSA